MRVGIKYQRLISRVLGSRQMMKWDQRLTSGCNPSVECITVRDIKSLYICTHLGVMPSLLVHKIIPFMCRDRDSYLVLCYA